MDSGLLLLEAVGVDEWEFQHGGVEESARSEAVEFEEFRQVKFAHDRNGILDFEFLILLECDRLKDDPFDPAKCRMGELSQIDELIGLDISLINYAPVSAFRRASGQEELQGIV